MVIKRLLIVFKVKMLVAFEQKEFDGSNKYALFCGLLIIYVSRRVFFLPSSSHGFPVIITITVLKLCFTFKVNIFKEAVVCSKEHRMAGFCEFLSTCGQETEVQHGNRPLTSDTTQILSFHVSGVKWCPFWWLKEKVKGSFGSRFLVFGVWIPSFWLLWRSLENLQSWGDFSSHLMNNTWLMLAFRGNDFS